MLSITTEELGNDVILRCAGRIVHGDETPILCAAVSHAGRNIVLDLSKVDALDVAGIGALIALQAAGIYLQLMNPPSAIRDVLHVTKLDSIFEICEPARAGSEKEKDELRLERSTGARFIPATAF